MGVSANSLNLELEEKIKEKQKEIINEALDKLMISALENTPKSSGRLKKSWRVNEAEESIDGEVEGNVTNDAPYGIYVNRKQDLLQKIKDKAGI